MQMKKMTGLTPSQIRRTQKIVTESAIQLRLHFRPPYNWPLLRDFLANRAISPIEAVTDNSYSKVFNVTKSGCVERFTATYAHVDNAFDIELYVEDVSRIANVIKTIKRILDLDADPTVIHSSLRACGLTHDSIDEGIRLPGVWSPFEAGCRAIIGQQISVKAAIQHIQNIVTHLSNNNPAAFPSPQQIIALDDALLKMPNARKRALKNFAQCFIDETEPDEKTLLAVKGIGPWTVNYVKLRGMSDPDLLLETDLIVANQLKARSLETDSAAPFRSYLTLQLMAVIWLDSKGIIMTIAYQTLETPVGLLEIFADEVGITRIVFNTATSQAIQPNEHTRKATQQLQEYIARERKTFDLPLNPTGTRFPNRGLGSTDKTRLWTNCQLSLYCRADREP